MKLIEFAGGHRYVDCLNANGSERDGSEERLRGLETDEGKVRSDVSQITAYPSFSR